MVDHADFEELCSLVLELARHTRTVALGGQSLSVDREITQIIDKVEELRERSRSGR